MVLKGKTDRTTIAKSAPKVDVRVFVGTPKKTSKNSKSKIFGDDLVNKFRIETTNPGIAKTLKSIGVNDQGLVDKLNIILAYSEPDKAYNCVAQNWSEKDDILSGLLWECDRETIYKKKIVRESELGKKGVTIECNEPCLVAGTDDKCPKCKETGTLYFYIPELLDRGHNALCSLVLGGQFNIIELSDKLVKIQEQFGTIKEVSGIPESYNSVLFTMTRYSDYRLHPIFYGNKMTGKKKSVLTHLVDLNIDQAWLEHYRNIQRITQVQLLGGRPNLRLIQQAVGDDAIEQLPASNNNKYLNPVWQPSKEDGIKLRKLMEDYGWSNNELLKVVKKRYNIEALNDLDQINYKQWQDLLLVIKSPGTKSMYS